MTTTEVDQSDIIMPDGVRRYTHRYQVNQSGPMSFPRMELLVQFFYCDDLEMSVLASAVIKEEPFEQFIHEAREMMESLQCW